MIVHAGRLHVHGMYDRSISQPSFHFDFGGLVMPFRPVQPWHGLVHLGVLAFSATGMFLGIYARGAAAVFALSYAYFVLSERTMFNNHYYLYVLLAALLALVNPTQAFVVGPAYRARTPVPAWQRSLLRLQVPTACQTAGCHWSGFATTCGCRCASCTCTLASPSSMWTGWPTTSRCARSAPA